MKSSTIKLDSKLHSLVSVVENFGGQAKYRKFVKGVLIFGTVTSYILFYLCNRNDYLSKNLIVMNFHDPKEAFYVLEMKVSMVVDLW